MNRLFFYFLGMTALCLVPASAVQTGPFEDGANFDTNAPTATNIPNWDTGWGAPGISGWNYVGQINGGASGVYLGNGWVLTAAHVGPGEFAVDGGDYTPTGLSYSFTTTFPPPPGTTYPTDLTLFQISGMPDLPALTLALHSPTIASATNPGSQVAMIGFGGGFGETWGLNNVTDKYIGVTLDGYPYGSWDFETAYGPTAYGTTNTDQLYSGDSGGGDFIYNSSTGQWELAGINEAINPSIVDSSNYDSYMIQLNTYRSQIDPITATPEPETWVLVALGVGLVGWAARFRSAPPDRKP